MNTILIPVDFSAGTQNVLDFIAAASNDFPISRIILLKSTYHSVYQPILASAHYLHEQNFEADRESAVNYMDTLCKTAAGKFRPDLRVENAISELPLPRAILQIITQEQPDLLVLNSGITGKEGYISENLITLATISTIPVLVVPPQAAYRKAHSALVPIDFEELDRLATLQTQALIAKNEFHPFLKVFSIKKSQERDEEHDRQNLSQLLGSFSFSIHYSTDQDILQGILDFAGQHDPELIIALPGAYSFFKKLTHRSIAKAIALKSNHPVLILKQH